MISAGMVNGIKVQRSIIKIYKVYPYDVDKINKTTGNPLIRDLAKTFDCLTTFVFDLINMVLRGGAGKVV